MSAPSRTPPAGAVGALLAAIGFGVAGWYGWAWYQLPRWSEYEITGSVELNLALDLSYRPADSITPQEKDRMRAQIRREVEAEIEKERETPRSYTYAGLIIGLFGLAQMAIRSRLARGGRP